MRQRDKTHRGGTWATSTPPTPGPSPTSPRGERQPDRYHQSPELNAGIEQVAFVAPDAQDRLVLTGVEFNLEEEGLTMDTADGFRLSVYQAKLDSPTQER